jgi:aminomethyltransferase
VYSVVIPLAHGKALRVLQSPLHSYHQAHGARFVEFAGWQMPILYRSIHDEHRLIRSAAGWFDVSHMGRIKISGRHARKFLERILTRRISDMAPLSCRYSLICNDSGGVRDDVIVYRFENHFLLVVNACNRVKVLDHLRSQLGDLVVQIDDQTRTTAMVAVQGPRTMDLVGRLSREVPALKRYAFCIKNLLILELVISRTGYTGEDGIEIILPAAMAGTALKLLVKDPPPGTDAAQATQPCGLGARDTLRLEAGMPLYGHELDETLDPLSAGLAFAVNLDKDQQENGEPFLGQEALKKIAASGPTQRLVGLALEGPRTPRQGMAVFAGAEQVGRVTSGCLSPTLGYPIAMAYVRADHAEVGRTLEVGLGSQRPVARVVKLPFYHRPATGA